jgi:ribosome-associated toxin RatA of RatAB toxin-antitoxin module
MPHIENETLVNAPLERVYALARDVEAFPEYMPDVESVQVMERSPNGERVVTDWVGVASDFKLKVRWTEEDIWDDTTHTCRFSLVKGDYQNYGGLWTFSQEADGRTKFISSLDYDLDIPLIGALLKALVDKLMRANTQRLLDAVKSRAESEPTNSQI